MMRFPVPQLTQNKNPEFLQAEKIRDSAGWNGKRRFKNEERLLHVFLDKPRQVFRIFFRVSVTYNIRAGDNAQ